MSGEKATNPCNKFQANIFNKSKCQNCFKSRELHLLNDHDMEQAKPIYAGWLCLAPEGTDFDNPMQRSRKWQRRFFILYEDGSLRFALDEQPSTLPQGTVNLNLCTDITDAEPRTGQRNALCIVTPEQEIFIRGDNKEIINGWSEQLSVYLRTNKQNQKKKRKVEPVASQEPSPAKVAATDPSFPSSENTSESSCSRWQEDQQGRGPGETPMWTVTDTDPPGSKQTPAGDTSTFLSPVSRDSLICPLGSLDLVSSGNSNNQLTESNNNQTSTNNKNQSRDKSPSERLLRLEEKEGEDGTAVSRKGRSEARTNKQREPGEGQKSLSGVHSGLRAEIPKTASSSSPLAPSPLQLREASSRDRGQALSAAKLQSCGDIVQLTAPPPQRRARSLDRRTSDTVMTPDLLNFKKGWMVKLNENDQWKKFWFVLSTDSLRFYKDSIAEEASDLEGEIDLTKCFNVSEFQVQRNYGFQIHTPKGVYTLSAMTSGIRKNWIQALMKNVHPANAPDVASLPGHLGPPEALPKPDVTQDSPSADLSTDREPKHRTVMERRREGRYKTFDWAEFRPQKKKPNLDADLQKTKALCSLELADLERRKRREERRRRYESMLGISLGWDGIGDDTEGDGVRALSPKSQLKVEEDIEECWKLVEKTIFRLERTVPMFTEEKESVEMEKLLDSYRKGVEDLKAQLAESEHHRLKLEAQLSATGYYQQQLDPPLSSAADFCLLDTNDNPLNSHTQTLKDTYKETRELLQQQNIIRQSMQEQLSFEPPLLSPQTPQIWLHDTEGNLQELRDLLPETEVSPLLSPVFSQSDGETDHQNELNGEEQQVVSSETQINNSEYGSLILEKPKEEENTSLNGCVEHHIPPDQAVVRRLSQEVELLTSQNEALNQRNQEMLNQLTEADREIERLKAELSSRYTEPHHLPEVEQLEQTGVGDLERELNLKNQQLLEAQSLIASLEENLRETEALLQLNAPGQEKKEEVYLLQLTELQAQNDELKEAEKLYRQTAAEAEADIRRLNEELQKERSKVVESNRCVSGEERIQQVIEGVVMRLSALGKLLEAIEKLDVGLGKEESEEMEPTVLNRLKWEEEFWRSLLDKLNPEEVLLTEATERMIMEKQMLLLGNDLLPETDEGLKDVDIICNIAGDESRMFEIKHFRVVTQMKMSLLNHLATSVSTYTRDKLQLMADRISNFYFSEHPWSGLMHSAATEALFCCRLNRLQSKYEEQLEKTKQKQLTASLICSSCVSLMEENRVIREVLSNLEDEKSSSSVNKVDVCCQTEEIYPQDTDVESQAADETPEVEMFESLELNFMEIPPSGIEGPQEIEDETREKNDASHEESDLSFETEEVLELRRRVKELEEQLTVLEEELKEEFDGKMSFAQMQHEKEMEKLKVTCERGFTSMEESHVKVVEELQRRHQQEVERLLVERDQLLDEESAATATAIEAIKNAHRLELEREVEKRCQSENSTGETHLEYIYRQHSEELTSYQRELEVLSQQFSLKCLENGHLVQALDAERKALCQCQQENQDLRTRNQELSGHLAAEITRLCSLAKQDALPLNQGMDVYEMEITLRVKESEVQCLKQEITSLKDELQSAQKDKRNATKKYKDMYAELSVVRAKTEREMDELRENLRLAHRALDDTSP